MNPWRVCTTARLTGVEFQHGHLAMFSMKAYNLHAIVNGQDPTDGRIFRIDSPAAGHTFEAFRAAQALLRAFCNVGSERGASSTVAAYERHPRQVLLSPISVGAPP